MNYTRVINRPRGVRSAKKITERSLIGERGVALIRKRVLDMGYVWHDRRSTRRPEPDQATACTR
jgi:hypothetical protein